MAVLFRFETPVPASDLPSLEDCRVVDLAAEIQGITVHVDTAANKVLAVLRARAGGPDCVDVALEISAGEDMSASAAEATAVAAADRRIKDVLMNNTTAAVVTQPTPPDGSAYVTFYFEQPIDPEELAFEHCAPHHRSPGITGLVSWVRPAERVILGLSPQWDGRVHCLP